MTSVSSPYQLALRARWLLARPGRTGAQLPVGAMAAEVAAGTTLVVAGRATALRMVTVQAEGDPAVVWLVESRRLWEETGLRPK